MLRVVTYNIHKGVRGLGPRRRLEIHNLAAAIRHLASDVVLLQEVRLFHHADARRFRRGPRAWPAQGQAEFLAPPGWHHAYRTNAVTAQGEHGNALLSCWPLGVVGHADVSDHRLEQRGLLHVPVNTPFGTVHGIVAHFGLIHTSRLRQAQRLAAYVQAHVPPQAPVLVGGDFNDWNEGLDAVLAAAGLERARGPGQRRAPRTFPARLPLFALDRFYTRGLVCERLEVPVAHAGASGGWRRWSDHLPLCGDFALA